MLFKIDENLPVEAAILLRRNGHDTATVCDESLQGHPDEHIAEACRREQRVLITLDVDFSDIRTYPPEKSPGCVGLRLSRLDKTHVLTVLERTIPMFQQEPLSGHLWIVDEARLRIRGAN